MSGLWTVAWWSLFGAIAVALYDLIRTWDQMHADDREGGQEGTGSWD